MSILIKDIEVLARRQLSELVPKFWSSEEIVAIIGQGVKDLWRDIANLKQEHFLKVNDRDVVLKAGERQFTGVPRDVHKIYMVEARDLTLNGSNVGVAFEFKDWNHPNFKQARSMDSVDPSNCVIYVSPMGAGGPDGETIVRVAPTVTADLNITFAYVPTLSELKGDDQVPIPGEASNALVAWTMAYARAKETEDRSPDPNWLSVYSTEKQHLLESLGLRQYQDAQYVDALFEEYWG